ncbi:glycoside hydrolase family 43 protein [Oceanispirochaeta sp.]|uniref:glycoside hydrolase family 43 protein n=1 Tax=Oceanispirochaeta sp. TaxID=2035350 RepID=UPI002612D4C9|nr:glycoside hydrolase family 43 protein [Oceanispirochaeta sp.]MDA3957872.1 glycoside hydrolase family 43 protein [Oceanispirochaeta sp.]
MNKINNPILPGFNPDPSIVRVEDTYYIANSTFQWFPGVQIHKSKDLANWELVTRPLESTKLLDMKGIPDHGGIWAPCLSYSDGRFWLIYTNVHSLRGIYKDTPNYLTTAESIEGPWSDPVYINSSGFDPSLFHDDDGKKYFINMIWDHRPWKKNSFYGIVMQEYSTGEQKLIGTPELIFKGSDHRLVEGPHLYKKDGFYYLFCAEGGTSYDHCETVARSRNINGPYEIHPQNPLITARDYPDSILQKTGHGDIVQTPGGEWYFVHLTGRPSLCGGFCVLGRETAIEKIDWPMAEWPRIATGGNEPALSVPLPKGSQDLQKTLPPEESYSFNAPRLAQPFQTLRVPQKGNMSLSARPGYLRMYGKESLSSLINQSLVGLRVDHPVFTASTVLEFDPWSFQQSAGLSAYYDTSSYYYLHMSFDEERKRVLHLQTCRHKQFEYPVYNINIPDSGAIHLKVEIDAGELQFFWSLQGKDWNPAGPRLKTDVISDDFEQDLRFTGAFCALCCQDLAGTNHPADFEGMSIKRG